MALQMKLEMDTGVILPEAYVRITEGILSLDRGITFITVQTYASEQARLGKKKPVLTHEVACTMDGAKPQKDAKYSIKLRNAGVGSAMSFSVNTEGKTESKTIIITDVDGNKIGEEVVVTEVSDIEFIEGTHITTDGTLGTYTQAVVDNLNKHAEFMYDYIASSNTEGEIIVKPLDSGSKTGGSGNGLKFFGDAVESSSLDKGNDRVYADFEMYFGIEAMNKEGSNAILQAYEFIKTLPEYQGAIDVL